MSREASSADAVTLRDGPTVSARVLSALLSLERRGFRFSLAADGRLYVRPSARLPEPDRVFVQRHRDAICEIVAYCDGLASEVPA